MHKEGKGSLAKLTATIELHLQSCSLLLQKLQPQKEKHISSTYITNQTEETKGAFRLKNLIWGWDLRGGVI